MMLRLVIGLLFIVVPVLELALLVKTGQLIGFWATLLLVLTTAASGAIILSRQSFKVVGQALEALSEGRPPVAPVLEGLFLMLAGALLLTPGLITDVAALLLLVPPIRRAVARWSVNRLLQRADVGVFREGGDPDMEWRPHSSAGAQQGPIIEGEFERLGEESRPQRGNGAAQPPSKP
jgi:UPF0716 protein FxsA